MGENGRTRFVRLLVLPTRVRKTSNATRKRQAFAIMQCKGGAKNAWFITILDASVTSIFPPPSHFDKSNLERQSFFQDLLLARD